MKDKYITTRFNHAPTINKSRTQFDLSHSILTTGNTGQLITILMEPVNPGETFSLKTSSLVRLETSLHQTMDNAYVELAYFFVPNDILWEHWNEFNGANDDPWTQTTNYTVPGIELSGGNVVDPQSIINDIGIPAGTYGNSNSSAHFKVSQLPLRAVFECYNQYYRDENYDSIVYYSKGDYDYGVAQNYLFNGSPFYPNSHRLHVNRLHDLFSTALPAPQRGAGVSFSIGSTAPIVVGSSAHAVGSNVLQWVKTDGTAASSLSLHTDTTGALVGSNDTSGYDVRGIAPSNLEADLSSATAVTVNDLRLAIATQAIQERDARSGTRAKERNYSVWGVNTPDLELDRPEFLGGKRIPVSMMEVLQTSETGTTVLGTDAGHSKTVDYSDGFLKSFTKAGWIVGFAYVRTARSYSQGIDRKLFMLDYFDHYDPMLDNIGEVDVKKVEIYALGMTNSAGVTTAEGAWGYQEPWYFLKERNNRFYGYFQPRITGTLDSWHYGDSYSAMPSMSSAWLKEDESQVDRTIAVSSSISYQWSFNIHFDLKATRPMRKYAVPNTFGFGF